MRTRENNFVKFMRDKNPLGHELKQSRIDIGETRLCIDTEPNDFREFHLGRRRALGDLFVWTSTPQGHDYWSHRRDGLQPLSEEDIEFVREVERQLL